MDVDLSVPGFFGGLFHGVAGAGAGVVDQDVELAVGGHGGGHGVNPVLFVGNVQLDEDGIAAGGADLLGGTLAVFNVDVAQDDLGPFLAEHSGRGAAEAHQRSLHAAGRAANQRYLAFQPHSKTSCLGRDCYAAGAL